jgi:histidine ammonia-lyase
MKIIILDGQSLTLADAQAFLEGKAKVRVTQDTMRRLGTVRKFIEKKMASHEPFYGINTGFGMLAAKRIPDEDLEELQENLIVSHAVGTGNYVPDNLASLIMLLRANVLAKGYSGIKPETLILLVEMINRGIIPLIPEQGSVGASGDLAPLAHIALAMTGKGNVRYRGKVMTARQALTFAKLSPVRLSPKEGIALINGTQAMAAVSVSVITRAERLIKLADIAGALSVEGDRASRRPFDERIHKLRPHPGQLASAANMRKLLEKSQIIESHAKCRRVQDPYSFRCIPQVHGAVKDAFRYAKAVVEKELNSCTDNPIVFHEDDEIISGGNFHGEPLSMAMDVASIALAELGSISERRVAILLSPLEGELPTKYLISNPGLNSGLAPMHVTMASLVSENKTLAHPAVVDTIPTFAGQEDHVSMGMWAARKAFMVLSNVEAIIAMELLAACQAIDIQKPLRKSIKCRPGAGTKIAYSLIRRAVPYLEDDREIQKDMAKALEIARSGVIVEAVEAALGPLRL